MTDKELLRDNELEKWDWAQKRGATFDATEMIWVLTRLREARAELEQYRDREDRERWIPVGERLPDYGAWVWVVYGERVQHQAAHRFNDGFANNGKDWWSWADDSADRAPFDCVTHWRPLPLPPTGGAELEQMKNLDNIRREKLHSKFGFVEGADGKCACGYCSQNFEAVAELAAEQECDIYLDGGWKQRAVKAEAELEQYRVRERPWFITIQQSRTADTRSCDFSQVTKETLLESSVQHIADVVKGLEFFRFQLLKAGDVHDWDKLKDIDGFHRDFVTGFKQTTWWDNHRKVNRHHLLNDDGVPADVNLIDVLDMIADCVMAGMGRTGEVYPLNIKPEVLMAAFQNTITLLKERIVVAIPTPPTGDE